MNPYSQSMMLKRSVINQAIKDAKAAFQKDCWYLPPEAAQRWDVTDFGLGEFRRYGLTIVNLTPPDSAYCEKVMFVYKDQRTPAHAHHAKTEDIICRCGKFKIQLWDEDPGRSSSSNGYNTFGYNTFDVSINGQPVRIRSGETLEIRQGSRITLTAGLYHEFWSVTPFSIIGEVSIANDDVHDNFFANKNIGRFPSIVEDEEPILKLVGERTAVHLM